ncbi:MAG TPA: zinc-dependent peptidase [Chitinophagaceae bacterium]|jgi:hypothetical protein|nr:zinc-dependent peptidase [Chitinophagaceae bacterium]
MAVVFILVTVVLVARVLLQKDPPPQPPGNLFSVPPPPVMAGELSFPGSASGIPLTEMERILEKRFVYYQCLDGRLRRLFLRRLHRFIEHKHFIIKDDEGFREMPVLVSAAAIQLTFGLKHYFLPFYRYIRIYPQEYVADHALKVLAGNVQGNTITVAWNHFLEGYAKMNDGANVGLHEMSHALYIQKMVIGQHPAEDFGGRWTSLMNECKLASEAEAQGRYNLYSPYADTNLQEFWAESVELFFEKPAELRKHYPDVYAALQALLNQDPLNPACPLLKNNRTFREKMNGLMEVYIHNSGSSARKT